MVIDRNIYSNYPSGWIECSLLRYIDSIVDYRGKTPKKVNDGVFLVTARNIKDGKIDYSLSQEYVREEDYEEIMHRGKLHIGDVLFTTEAPMGEVANVDRTDFALAQRVIKFSGVNGKLNNYFLKYWMLNPVFQDQLKSLGTGSTAQGIKASKLGLLRILIPPWSEQTNIVKFLNYKCAKLDTLSDNLQKQIEILKAYKHSIITETVTKGLNKNAPMKDSGVEYLGSIPRSWNISKIKYIADLNPTLTRIFDQTKAVGYVPMNSVKNGYMEPLESLFQNLSTGLTAFQDGDIVMAKVTPCFENGNIAIAQELAQGVAFGSSELFVFRAHHINTKFLFYCLQNRAYMRQAASTMTGTGGLKRVSLYFVANTMIPLPEKHVQEEIVNYLDHIILHINHLISNKQSQMDTLEAYKKSLIYEYVTGKKEVPAKY